MIELKHITKIYNCKKSNAFTALKDVSLNIEDGDMVAIVGKSGAGKSTLMHILGCIDTFEEGEYLLDNIKVNKLRDKKLAAIRNKKIGIVMQDFSLVEEYTVLENVKIPLYFSNVKSKESTKRALEALEKVEIKELANKPVNKLSGGQKQRAAIARAIVNNPDIILADEPTGALDTETSKQIIELFIKLNGEGKTVIIITHDPAVAKACKRSIQISDGKLI